MWTRIKRFFEEARTEIRHVNWPTRAEAVRLTAIVIVISVGLAVFLGFFDWLFTNLIKTFVLG
jgi:preprotein translocase subunit SecE